MLVTMWLARGEGGAVGGSCGRLIAEGAAAAGAAAAAAGGGALRPIAVPCWTVCSLICRIRSSLIIAAAAMAAAVVEGAPATQAVAVALRVLFA